MMVGGIDSDKLVNKAISNGILSKEQSKQMTPQEKLDLIFLPGLSTAEKVSEVSGRGVGMDVVKTNIEKLGGHVELDSVLGEGSTVLLRLPLTLAIIPSLIVRVEKQRFAVPQVNIVELVWVRAGEVSKRIEQLGSIDVLRLRGKLLPLVRLADVLRIKMTFVGDETLEPGEERRHRIADRRGGDFENLDQEHRVCDKDRRQNWQNDFNILVLRVGSNQFGIIVDELFETEEIVVKPLSRFIKSCKCFTGATIMGDGQVAMILDAAGISTKAQLSFAEAETENQKREEERLVTASNTAEIRNVLLFENNPEETFAFPVDAITRLESFRISDIKKVGSREYFNLLGKSTPLLRLENQISVRSFPEDSKEAFLLIPKPSYGRAGILASNIVDAVETNVALNQDESESRGVEGSAMLNDKLTVFLDPKELFSEFESFEGRK